MLFAPRARVALRGLGRAVTRDREHRGGDRRDDGPHDAAPAALRHIALIDAAGMESLAAETRAIVERVRGHDLGAGGGEQYPDGVEGLDLAIYAATTSHGTGRVRELGDQSEKVVADDLFRCRSTARSCSSSSRYAAGAAAAAARARLRPRARERSATRARRSTADKHGRPPCSGSEGIELPAMVFPVRIALATAAPKAPPTVRRSCGCRWPRPPRMRHGATIRLAIEAKAKRSHIRAEPPTR